MQQTPGKPNAFTLIELLLYMGISTSLLLAVSFFLSLTLQSRIKQQTIAEVEQQGAQTLQYMLQALRNAESVQTPALGTQASSLLLDMADPGKDPTIFSNDEGAIRITEGGGASLSLTSSRLVASELMFSNLSRSGTPGTIRIRFLLTHRNPEMRNEFDFSKEFVGSASLRYP